MGICNLLILGKDDSFSSFLTVVANWRCTSLQPRAQTIVPLQDQSTLDKRGASKGNSETTSHNLLIWMFNLKYLMSHHHLVIFMEVFQNTKLEKKKPTKQQQPPKCSRKHYCQNIYRVSICQEIICWAIKLHLSTKRVWSGGERSHITQKVWCKYKSNGKLTNIIRAT